MLAALLIGAAPRALAQPAEPISVTLDVRTEGRASRDAAATRLLADVTQRLEAIPDVEVRPREEARRTIWIVTGAAPGPLAVSMIVTEHYDRETLMVLGIEDDDMAGRMMAHHQIFTGRDPATIATIATRIVASVNEGIFAKRRTLKPKP